MRPKLAWRLWGCRVVQTVSVAFHAITNPGSQVSQRWPVNFGWLLELTTSTTQPQPHGGYNSSAYTTRVGMIMSAKRIDRFKKTAKAGGFTFQDDAWYPPPQKKRGGGHQNLWLPWVLQWHNVLCFSVLLVSIYEWGKYHQHSFGQKVWVRFRKPWLRGKFGRQRRCIPRFQKRRDRSWYNKTIKQSRTLTH